MAASYARFLPPFPPRVVAAGRVKLPGPFPPRGPSALRLTPPCRRGQRYDDGRSCSTTAWRLRAASTPKIAAIPCVLIVPQDTTRLVKRGAADAAPRPPTRRPILILPITA